MMNQFQPPPFRPHLFIRGGHLQTIAAIPARRAIELPSVQHVVTLSDGDAIVLHEDVPPKWASGDASMLLVHGLCGCHAANYMVRLAGHFFDSGVRVFRLDMRGCGAATQLARQLTHAGRSDDIVVALSEIADRTGAGKIGAIGVSLGGNQMLRALGRVGAGLDPTPSWLSRLDRVAVVAPPVDLQRCSDNMERWALRPYNYYFIRRLLSRVPAQVRRRTDYQQAISGRRPRTLWQLDERLTAPLSGFRDAQDYYQQSSAMTVTGDIPVKTLVIAAADDPVVPIECLADGKVNWSPSTELLVAESGGHAGFIDRTGQSWMDEVLAKWFQAFST
jgi:predicted alpha/beta-fold hydrolase